MLEDFKHQVNLTYPQKKSQWLFSLPSSRDNISRVMNTQLKVLTVACSVFFFFFFLLFSWQILLISFIVVSVKDKKMCSAFVMKCTENNGCLQFCLYGVLVCMPNHFYKSCISHDSNHFYWNENRPDLCTSTLHGFDGHIYLPFICNIPISSICKISFII